VEKEQFLAFLSPDSRSLEMKHLTFAICRRSTTSLSLSKCTEISERARENCRMKEVEASPHWQAKQLNNSVLKARPMATKLEFFFINIS
jgi:hypothetical protein